MAEENQPNELQSIANAAGIKAENIVSFEISVTETRPDLMGEEVILVKIKNADPIPVSIADILKIRSKA